MTTPFEFRPVLFAVFWKSGIALGAALCISRMLRNRSADLRRLVFSTTIVAMFVAAAATPMLPRWTAVTPLWFHFQRPAPAAVAESSLSSPMVDDAKELTGPVSRPMPPQTGGDALRLYAGGRSRKSAAVGSAAARIHIFRGVANGRRSCPSGDVRRGTVC